MQQRIWLSLAHMGGKEQAFIQEAFDTNWVVPLGPNVDGFEADLEKYLQVRNKTIAALCSGTAAIHLGLLLAGVEKGDEVICQSFTFSASCNPIVYLGATPVFVDSEKDTWNMDPALLREAIEDRLKKTGRKPKASVPVHLYGMPAKMDEIMAIANQYGIPVVEDAAEALGSTYKGRPCGTWGRFGILSFNGNKMITTSGGGALICPDEENCRKAIFYATQAREPYPYYQHMQIGYNYRLSNICAGIGRGQMLVLDEHIARRRQIQRMYREAINPIPGCRIMDNPSADFNSNFWLSCILVDKDKAGFSAEELRLYLESQNIESRRLWKPMHLQPVFAHVPSYTHGISDAFFETGLCLPSGSSLTDEEIQRVISCIQHITGRN